MEVTNLQRVAFALPLGAILLFLAGMGHYEGYLKVFGLEADMFPKETQAILHQGYVVLLVVFGILTIYAVMVGVIANEILKIAVRKRLKPVLRVYLLLRDLVRPPRHLATRQRRSAKRSPLEILKLSLTLVMVVPLAFIILPVTLLANIDRLIVNRPWIGVPASVVAIPALVYWVGLISGYEHGRQFAVNPGHSEPMWVTYVTDNEETKKHYLYKITCGNALCAFYAHRSGQVHILGESSIRSIETAVAKEPKEWDEVVGFRRAIAFYERLGL